MRFQFESNLDYQLDAIEAVCDLFRGQEVCRTEFTVTRKWQSPAEWGLADGQPEQISLGIAESDLGIGNLLNLSDDRLFANLVDAQLRRGLLPSSSLSSSDFTIEMETGTGKTYVYLRTAFELNKRYGFTKFVVVVPSVAIKEGVYKTLQVTAEHFRALYAGVPFDYFLYDSSSLGQVRNFSTSPTIQIMVVTVGAINKRDVNNLYKDSEQTGGEKPIDLIRATRPIVIVDEPQSVDGGLEGRGKEALDSMNPLCTLRYSATHLHKHHMIFRLDAVDAYERKLVKQIEVASATVEDAFNKPYVRFLAPVIRGRKVVGAKVAIHALVSGKAKEIIQEVQPFDSLETISGREIYRGISIGSEIVARRGQELLELRHPGGETFLEAGQAYGGVDSLAIHRQMIRRTIKEHFDKEMRLRPAGIKVLSLFFIDSVGKYRRYSEEGKPEPGEYATIFEEEYRRTAKLPAYASLFGSVDLEASAREAHNGYFSIDKQGRVTDTSETNAGSRESAERAFSLIMREKEQLLSFETPLRFIFSHSALREGWDNPNVFQICTLREIQTERERRQTIGRGLRLCVNQDGDRVRGFEVNTLTVIATESYEQFAEELQKEVELETGVRFGVVEKHQFASVSEVDTGGEVSPIGFDRSLAIWEFLRNSSYIDADGRIQDLLKSVLRSDALQLPGHLGAVTAQVSALLRKLAGGVKIKNADERKVIALRKDAAGKAAYLSDDFRQLWDRIKLKTTYRVNFDNAKLLAACIAAVVNAPPITKSRLEWRKAELSVGKAGITAMQIAGSKLEVLEDEAQELPDLLTSLQDRTQLTRRSLVRILTESDRLADFRRNPQMFIEVVSEAINRCKRLALVDGIKYQQLGSDYAYAQELFEREELTGYLKDMMHDVKKSIYEDVVFDSSIERAFAESMERNDAVKLYVKLPVWFKIPTPLGSYNPDWAVLIEEGSQQRLFFVVETKSSLFSDDLRESERAKIDCGKAHFGALAIRENPARYVVEKSLEDLLSHAHLSG